VKSKSAPNSPRNYWERRAQSAEYYSSNSSSGISSTSSTTNATTTEPSVKKASSPKSRLASFAPVSSATMKQYQASPESIRPARQLERFYRKRAVSPPRRAKGSSSIKQPVQLNLQKRNLRPLPTSLQQLQQQQQKSVTFTATNLQTSPSLTQADGWTIDEVASWIDSLHLDSRFKGFFLRNKVAGKQLRKISHEALKEIGVEPWGHRITILENVEELFGIKFDRDNAEEEVEEEDDEEYYPSVTRKRSQSF